jgi:lipopolysaccharide biosynthesis regulator YciM
VIVIDLFGFSITITTNDHDLRSRQTITIYDYDLRLRLRFMIREKNNMSKKHQAKRSRRKKNKQRKYIQQASSRSSGLAGISSLFSGLSSGDGEPVEFPPDFPPFPPEIEEYGRQGRASMTLTQQRRRITKHWEAAMRSFNNGRYANALPEFQRSISLMTQGTFGPEAIYNLAQCYANEGEREAFFTTMTFYAELKPKDHDPYYALAYAALEAENYTLAVELGEEGRKRAPRNEKRGLVNLARAYAHLNRYEESIKTLKDAIRIDPTWAMAHQSLGAAYEDIGEIEKAKDAYRQAARFDPSARSQLERLESGLVIMGGPPPVGFFDGDGFQS